MRKGSQIGTVREVVSRTLRILVDAGAITLDNRRVTVRDHSVLERIAGGAKEEVPGLP